MKNKFISIFACFMVISILVREISASETKEEYIARAKYAFNNADEQYQILIDHLEDTKCNLTSGTASFDIIDKAIEATSASIQWSKLISEITEIRNPDIDTLHAAINIHIQGLIETRFKNIYIRLTNINNTQEGNLNNCVPSYRSGTKELTSEEKFMENVRIDTYQTLNRVIAAFFPLLNLAKIDGDTKNLIRMSPSLWPFLQAPSDDWGHVDDATFAQSEDEVSDLDYYRFHIKKEVIGKFIPRELPMPCFLTPIVIQPLAKAESTSKDDWLEGQPGKEKKINKKTTGKKKTSGKKMQSPRPLKTSYQLQSNAVNDANDTVIDDSLSAQVSAPEQQKELPTASSADSTQHETESPLTTAKVTKSLEKAPALTSEQNQFLKASDSEDEFVARSEYDPRAKHQIHQSFKNLKMAAKDVSKEDEVISADTFAVRGVHLQTLNQIFDKTAFHQISYNQFESLWINRGGVIPDPKSGGSHRSLYWNGQKVGSTFKPHGGHDYGPRCIKYLRIALEKIMPTSLLSQMQGHK